MKYSNITNCIVTASILFGVFAIVTPSIVSAKIGVGMGAGEVRVTEPIKPGGIYTLPSLRIFNTGDETTTYGMNVAYHQDHTELRPNKDWFTFTPATFTLEPGSSQEVAVTMLVPVKAGLGDYFAFVESGPDAENGPGTSVGVAVATKLYFTVVYANIWQAITYRIGDIFAAYSPWSWISLTFIFFFIFVLLLKRFFSFNVSLKKNSTHV